MATKVITYDEIKTEADSKMATLETANDRVPDLHDLTHAVATELGAMGKLHGSTLMAAGVVIESMKAPAAKDEPEEPTEPLKQIIVDVIGEVSAK